MFTEPDDFIHHVTYPMFTFFLPRLTWVILLFSIFTAAM